MKRTLLVSSALLLGSCASIHTPYSNNAQLTSLKKDIDILKYQAAQHELELQLNTLELKQQQTISALSKRIQILEGQPVDIEQKIVTQIKPQPSKSAMIKAQMKKDAMIKAQTEKPAIELVASKGTNEAVIADWHKNTPFTHAFNYIIPHSQNPKMYREKLSAFCAFLTKQFTSGQTTESLNTG
ncbi:MAG: hypothetical protein HRT88_18860, partial [Lentisphaeraceae bacterium]|nr:hypothetical protein [Lentisphaeraceae bacterium]